MKACPQCHIRYPADTTFCFLDGAELTAIRDPLIGKTIAGRYVIEGLLGEGGMAKVYGARHKIVDRPCAVKVMNTAFATDATVRERFRREAKSAQTIAHPNVIEIFDQGETEDGTPYMVMELLDGRTLSAFIDVEPFSPARAVSIMIQVARGVARAHDLGVVHRDLKPDNIYISSRSDGSDLVKILDFGIARSRSDSRLTTAGELFGTPQYLAPERISSGEAGPSVDLYALGVIFFEMLTAKLPFEASDAATFLIMHLKDAPKAPRAIDRRIPEKLDALILQLLEKDPRARPVDARRLEHDLVVIAQEIGARVPLDPEKDPASSRPPARTLPSLVAEQWGRRVEVFGQMLQHTYGANPPREQERALADLKRLVREITEVRKSNAKEQRALEEIDTRGRDGRQRFGFAVDALGIDASKAKDDVRTVHAEVERQEAEAKLVRDAYLEAQRNVLSWEGRSGQMEPYAQLADAYRKSAAAVDKWLAVRKVERTARSLLEEKERTASDLEYQITELRTALANHEQGIDREREATNKRAIEFSARAESIESQLLQLAARFCEPLRARPDLGALFQQLESETVAAGYN
jgi:serine/threonine-protein kinase